MNSINIINDNFDTLVIIVEVTPNSDGKRLDVFLTEELKELEEDSQLKWFERYSVTRSLITKAISDGRVKRGETVLNKSSSKTKLGEIYELSLCQGEPLNLLPDPDVQFEIVHEDSHILVINKPAGLVVHPGSGVREKTLVNGLIHYFGAEFETVGGDARPGLVHRLDKDTTGLMVVAKTPKSFQHLVNQFQSRSISRQYKALVLELPKFALSNEHGRIDKDIARDPKNRTRMAVVELGGKPAITNWTVAQVLKYGLLLDVSLETGRTHQIRVHLHYSGSPIVGDQVYPCIKSRVPSHLQTEVVKFARQALHAWRLKFVHPGTDKDVVYEAEMPDDMKQLVERFNREI